MAPLVSSYPPVVATELRQHLEDHYRVRVARLVPLEPWAPKGVQRVHRSDGPDWVARVFPSGRPVSQTEDDAEVLRFLEAHDFPAERCAHPEPVSSFDGGSVLVTEYVEGVNLRGDMSPSALRDLGDLLGRMHLLDVSDAAIQRPGGCWHHLSYEGGPRADADALLAEVEDVELRHLIDEISDHDDLPPALVHPDYCGPNALRTPTGTVIVDWTSAGRGARILSLGTLLRAGQLDLALVDAVVDGYAPHVRLEAHELERLPAAIRIQGLVLGAWGVGRGYVKVPDLIRDLAEERQASEQIAARAARGLAGA